MAALCSRSSLRGAAARSSSRTARSGASLPSMSWGAGRAGNYEVCLRPESLCERPRPAPNLPFGPTGTGLLLGERPRAVQRQNSSQFRPCQGGISDLRGRPCPAPPPERPDTNDAAPARQGYSRARRDITGHGTIRPDRADCPVPAGGKEKVDCGRGLDARERWFARSGVSICSAFYFLLASWPSADSGRLDLNQRPLRPERSALPS